MLFPDIFIFIRKFIQLVKVNRLVTQLDLVGTSSGPSNIKTTSEEGSSEHFPPLTTNAICHSSAALVLLE